MNAVLAPTILTYSVNSKLLVNSFKNVTNSDALKRPNRKTNSMMFLLLHIIDARYFILKQLDKEIKNPFGKYVDWANSIEDIKIYPKLNRVLTEWKVLNKIFMKKLETISSDKLKSKIEFQFPGGNTALNMISFLSEHEAYHVGQLGLIRKFLGFPSVKF